MTNNIVTILKKISRLIACSFLISIGAAQASTADLMIRNVSLISPERTAPLDHATVIIRDGKIDAIYDHTTAPHDDLPVLDGSGLYLTPGLMDSHLHTLVIPGLGFVGGQRSQSFAWLTNLYQRQLERSLLYFGVTQILDPAAHPAALARSRERELAPDIFFCGAAPVANGYPALFMDAAAIEATLPYRVYEPSTPASATGKLDRSQHSPEAIVKRMRDDGAICLKLFFEDGWDQRNDWPMLSDDSIKRIIDAAHASGLKVVAHANALDMQQQAVAAGVDVLGHGLWNWNQYRKHQGMPEAIRNHLDTIHEAGIGYQPTLRVMDSMRELYIPEKLHDPALKKVVPKALLDWYQTPVAHAFKNELREEDFEGLPDARITKLLTGPIGRSERSLLYLAQTGHKLLLASDHPATPGHANHPGLSSYQELVHMAALGIPLRRILEAATINNAQMFGLDDRYGSIETGKNANLLLLKANPLETIEAWDKIQWVILGGRVIDRESLSAESIAR